MQDKIEARLAKAQGRAELEGSTVESRMLEVEQAQRNVDAQRRLSEMRSKLGIAEADTATTTDAPAATEPSEGEEQAQQEPGSTV